MELNIYMLYKCFLFLDKKRPPAQFRRTERTVYLILIIIIRASLVKTGLVQKVWINQMTAYGVEVIPVGAMTFLYSNWSCMLLMVSFGSII